MQRRFGRLLLNIPFRSRHSQVGRSEEVASLCAHTTIPDIPPESVTVIEFPIAKSNPDPVPVPDQEPLPLPPPPPPPPVEEEEKATDESDDKTISQYGNKIVGSTKTTHEIPESEGLSTGAIVGIAAAAAIVAAVLMALVKRRRNGGHEKDIETDDGSQDVDEIFLDEEGVPPPPPMEA